MKRSFLLALTALLSIALFSTSPCYGQTSKSVRKPAKTTKRAKTTKTKPGKPSTAQSGKSTRTASVIKKDIKVGSGAEAATGQTVAINYTGWRYDQSKPGYRGMQIDSSLDRGKPFEFRLGAGQVMNGWDDGVAGMKVGGKRTLIIPAGLSYTTRSMGGVAIPPHVPLIYDVELLGVR